MRRPCLRRHLLLGLSFLLLLSWLRGTAQIMPSTWEGLPYLP
jgi:hypothetical protein